MLIPLVLLAAVLIIGAGLYTFARRPRRLLADDEANEVLEPLPVGRHRRRADR